ncbi:MAG: hypothetical protein AABW84_02250 [Nanoarchaeota archaeon]
MNKRGIQWEFIVLLILAIVFIVFALLLYSNLFGQAGEAAKNALFGNIPGLPGS